MEVLYMNGVLLAEVLQNSTLGLEKFWAWITYVGDPKCVFLNYFTITYFLDKSLGLSVLWIALVSEWLNLVFKWFLFGERPFWWVHESGISSKLSLQIQQFPSSCETGPGSPSGHCMITGAALWSVAAALSAYMSHCSQSCLVKFTPFVLYFLFLLAVGVSRIFILAHFPHQVAAGIVVGAILGHVLNSQVPKAKKLGFYVLTSLALILGSSLLYWSVIGIGIDLSWSIHLATKWCTNAQWIQLDTRPFSSLTRDAGSVLGLGLALHSPLFQQIRQQKFDRKGTAWCIVLALGFVHILDQVPVSVSYHVFFYALNFLKYTLVPWLVMVGTPRFVLFFTKEEIPAKHK
nr:glucose-6-phosphatase 3 isoform X2 [Geotrypetes seraphini]XP_033775243.1 glucose-6-phosphatase 3 isoform X2 [Geotrypetes seraphini]XP_033775244.1 glucose-6-phosphatase 3 isoform X2 [Geotrypetes seraphini]